MKHTSVIMIMAGLILGWASAANAATYTVTSTADSGSGSLRNTIASAAAGDTINFNLTYPATIVLSSSLTINKQLTIAGPSANSLTVSGNSAVRVFDVTGSPVTLSGLTVANGYVNAAGASGAGVRLGSSVTLNMDRCIVRNNSLAGAISGTTNYGAGVYSPASGTLNLNRCNFYSNSVETTYSSGGAIYSVGALYIRNCAITNNTGCFGSALMQNGGTGAYTMVNTTVSGNQTNKDGAVLVQLQTGGSFTIANCTITNNTSSNWEAGLFAGVAGTLILRNTIIAGNTATDNLGDSDIFFYTSDITFTSSGYNLIGSVGTGSYTWQPTDLHGTESSKVIANLASLADNSGYAVTHALNSGSVAINPSSSNSAPWVDGRGYLRSGNADRGAFEYQGTLPTVSAATSIGSTGFTANWSAVSGASGYYLDVATDAGFTNFVTGYQNLNVSNVVTYAVSGLTAGTTYYYRIRAYDSVGDQTWYSGSVSVACLAPTLTPSPTATRTPTVTPTLTATPSATASATVTPTRTASATASVSATPTATRTATITPTMTPTATASPTSTVTYTPTATRTSTVTLTSTASPTRTPTGSATATGTITPTRTASPTATVSPYVSRTVTPTVTATLTASSTATASATATLTLAVTATGDNAIRAFPNPASRRMRFQFNLAQAGEASVAIYNLAGERVAVLSGSLAAGSSELNWECANVASGVYLARVKANGVEKTLRLAVAR